MGTIIIADNQDITCLGLLSICNQIGEGIKAVECVRNKKELIRKLSEALDSIVILDYTLFDLVSIEELLILEERFEKSGWLLFSERLSEYFIRRMVVHKKTSIVLKDAPTDEIKKAITFSLRSQQFICQQISNLMQTNSDDALQVEYSALTTTEKEVLKLIALGKSTKEIAAERYSSIHTVATHRKNIFRKLDVNNIYEATKYALRAGIIAETEYYI